MTEIHPNGYPYMLFVKVDNEQEPEFFLAANEEIAKKNSFNSTAVDVLHLIGYYGHGDTNRFLKRIGKEWICKEGKIYYKGTNNNAAISFFRKKTIHVP